MNNIERRPARPPVKGGSERPARTGGFRIRITHPDFFRRPPPEPAAQQGFTFIGLLIVVMIMGAALAAMGGFFSHQAQREKERELLFVGDQFREAIGSYYRHSPGAAAYPKKLEDLLEDKRFPMPVRHLRRLYADPITGKADWGLVQAPGDAGIMGVYSASADAPIKTDNFDAADDAFKDSAHYADWKFVFAPPAPVAPAQTPAPPAPKG